jgi:adenine phosphoribosyltransferase
LLADPILLGECVSALTAPYRSVGITHVVGIESRGFLFGVPTALALGVSFVAVRKSGKLPGAVVDITYALEYGEATLVMQRDALRLGGRGSSDEARVLIVDDILATGGTLRAVGDLVEELGGDVVGATVVAELSELRGRQALDGMPCSALVAL